MQKARHLYDAALLCFAPAGRVLTRAAALFDAGAAARLSKRKKTVAFATAFFRLLEDVL